MNRELAGQVFGRLTVLGRAGSDQRGNPRWLCSCECGNATKPYGFNLRSGATRSCGCLNRETTATNHRQGKRTHGHASNGGSTGTYRSWHAMIQRCENPNQKHYNNYGGRGIKVCARWHDFENFLADMGERPEGRTLDRHPDNDGNYEPGNCRWATRLEQAKNRRPARRR